jgi:uncharacterized membrane protein
MDFPDRLFPIAWSIAAWIPVLAALGVCLLRAPWMQLRETSRFNVLAGAVVVLMLLWSMKAGVKPGLNLHLMGAAVMVLAFGPQLALVGLLAVLAGVTVNGSAAWSSFALNALVMVLVPVGAAWGWLRLAQRFLPSHLFVYIFVNGFFGAALAVMAIGLAAVLLLFAAGAYGAEYLLNEYLPYYVLLAFSEAWISGMAITLMVVYRPSWVATFDDARYLLNK